MHFFVSIYSTIFVETPHVSTDYFVHHQEFINLLYLQLCTNRANVHTAADTVNHELVMMNEMVFRNM